MLLAQKAKQLRLNKPYNPQLWHQYVSYIKQAKTHLRIVVLQKLMEEPLSPKKYLQAFDTLVKYHDYLKDMPELMKTARVIKHYPQDIKITKLGNAINTHKNEYSPVISNDGKRLYFCSRGRRGRKGGEDIYFSNMKNNQWQPAQLLSGINTASGNEAPESVSADQTVIYLFSGKNSGDIEYAEYGKNGWNTPKSIQKINTPYFEGDASVSPDGNVLAFVSDRLENYGLYHKRNRFFHGNLWGNTDIYFALKNAEGKWDTIIHAGKAINTPYAELSPFLHPDMRTLYFSSNGHGGLGGIDVFKSTRLYDTSWVYWSEPKSLGKEINTTGDDWGFKISSDGKKAYFARQQGADYDIFMTNLPPTAQPNPVFWVWGKIPFPTTSSVRIFWTDKNRKQVGEFIPTSGEFGFYLPPGKYTFYAETPNKYAPPVEIILEKKTNLKFDFREIDSSQFFRLKNIYFRFNSAELLPASKPELMHLVRFMQINADIKIEVIGYTDAVGSSASNLNLSEQRARNIVRFLVDNGIEENRLGFKGLGKQNLIKQTQKPEQINRRVEFRIIKN